MAWVVFLRGVNVGGHKKFKPADLARKLAAWDVVNVGAAGTFVVHQAISQAKLRAAIGDLLPFVPELMICPGRDLVALKNRPWFAENAVEEIRPFFTVLARRPPAPLKLPIARPADPAWQVKVVELRGKYALSLWRRQGARLLYPNEVVEKHFAVAATTRNWNTLVTLGAILEKR